MTAQPVNFSAFLDAARDSVVRELAALRRDAQRERDAFAAEMRAARAEWEARLAAVSDIERRLSDRIAALKDGEPGRDGADGKDGVSPSAEAVAEVLRGEVIAASCAAAETAIAAIPVPKDGAPGAKGERGEPGFALESFSTELVEDGRTLLLKFEAGDVIEVHEISLPQGPAGKDGKDGATGERGERGPEGAAGKLPTIRDWTDGVHYEGDVVAFDGSTWQACRDTGREPPHEDWICIARAGEDGHDGRSFRVRGTWDAGAEYSALDVVALNGASFAARRDAPGVCPGEGWQLIAGQGKPGKPGPKGDPGKGAKGDAGTPVLAISVDGQGLLTLINGDGSTVECDLYPVLAKLDR